MSLSTLDRRPTLADRRRPASTLAWRRADRRVGAALMVPALAVFAVFVFFPLGRVVWLSTQGTDIFGQAAGFVGTKNFATIFTDPQFGDTLWRTAVFCVAVVVGRIVVGLLIVIPLTAKLRGIRVFRALLTSPLVASVSVASVAFAAMLAPAGGLVNSVIARFGGTPVPWLTSTQWAMPSVIAVTVWGSLGFTVLLLLGAFGAIDPDVIEAAHLDGAGPLRTLWSISLPLITPTLFFIVVTGAVEALTTFGQIQILTGGGPANSTTTLVYTIYQAAFGAGSANFGIAAAVGVVLFLLVLGLSLVQFGVLEKRVNY
ncbi:sn-glycerol 3-phosphate transport system permease protein [Microbacterium sp. AG157]|uniref:carbohydrate ABC transporter permease n=1 Tax=Microbacterium TaxID=33882 RepID=UPI000E25B3A3|nr:MULTISPECIES: sugar ABC transporter permease [Microbacterium]RED00041.1 sn-glycerol 3-phosphate transport system permease protein [Microbacterium sp. AG157]WJS91254.1 sugar ABC transporter permease [Microbacterium testaceum]